MKTLKEHITELCTANEWQADKEGLWEAFESVESVVQTSEPDKHRWYNAYYRVAKIKIDEVDRFFEYKDIDTKEHDISREDCGWKIPDLDDLKEVFPYPVTRIEYK